MKKMMNLTIGVTLAAIVAVGLSGCSSISKQTVGSVTGSAVGGAVGSTIGKGHGRTVATIGGSVAGALLGGAIGKSMDQVDKMKMNQALENSRTGQATTWNNPDSGDQYTVTPTKTYTSVDNQPCRDFTTTATIEGQRQEVNGKACRQANGKWKVVA